MKKLKRMHMPKKPDYAVFELCIPYNVTNEDYPGIDDVNLQLDALLLQLNTGEYDEDRDDETEDEFHGTESEEMLADAGKMTPSQSAGSTALLDRGLGSDSFSGIVNNGAEGDAPIASAEILTPGPTSGSVNSNGEGSMNGNEINEQGVQGSSVKEQKTDGNLTDEKEEPKRANSAAELPLSGSESVDNMWPPLHMRTDSQGERDVSRASVLSYPDSTHEFFKPPAAKAREVIKQFLRDGQGDKVFEMLSRALKSDLNLDNAIYRILDILERRRIDLSEGEYLEIDTSASLLHIALLYGKENAVKRLLEKFPYLLYCYYAGKKYRNQTCFHIAVANKDCNMISMMLSTLDDRAERKMLLNIVADGSYFHERPEASTCLSAAAWTGQLEMIERLVVEGADLELRSVGGNTLLHLIVMLSIKNLSMLTARKLFKAVYENSAWWWGDAKDSGTSVDYDVVKKQAFQYLMKIPNDAGFSPLGLAVSLHSPLIGFILSFEPVYKLQQSGFGEIGVATYDVTSILSYKAPGDGFRWWHYDVSSLLHVLAHSDRVVSTDKTDGTIKDIAEMEPINSIVAMKWKLYRWLYLFWFAVHLIFMIVLTSTVMQYYQPLGAGQPGPVYGMFLPVPLVYLAFEVVDIAYTMYRYTHIFNPTKYALFAYVRQQLCLTGNIPYRVILFLFSMCMLIWCGLYYDGKESNDGALAMSLILGWLFMLFFSRGCRYMCRFTTMVQKIIFRDLIYFLAVFIFVLIGFSAAVHILMLNQPSTDAFFLLLSILTNADVRDGTVGEFGRPGIRFVLGTYGILAVILLLSLLIAMMVTTYETVKSSDTNLLRYQQLSIILMLERRFFWWTKLCKLSQKETIMRYMQDITEVDTKECRLFLNVPENIKH